MLLARLCIVIILTLCDSYIQKDGFVTPTTPDISIRTNHHIDSEAELKALSETGKLLLVEINVIVNTL